MWEGGVVGDRDLGDMVVKFQYFTFDAVLWYRCDTWWTRDNCLTQRNYDKIPVPLREHLCEIR